MSSKIRLCVNTQTPLVRFKVGYAELRDRYGYGSGPVSLDKLEQGLDYIFTPGGVTGMVHSALNRMLDSGLITNPTWVSLGPGSPREVNAGRIRLYNVTLDEEQLLRYAVFKEGIWSEIHGLGRLSFGPREYQAYVEYNWQCAKVMLDMLQDTDIYWVHDFQQLLVGNLIGPSAPAVFRWHIPFRLDEVSLRLRMLILKGIEGFDSIIVSTKRDLEGLIRAGYKGEVHAIYPFLNPHGMVTPSRRAIEAVRAKLGLKNDDTIALVVARLDPIKNQELAIKAVAKLTKEFSSLKLLVVGDGSFTSSASGGLGQPKAKKWKSRLKALVTRLGLQGNVVFTGYVSDEELNCLYAASEVVLVPSTIEGFNLTAAEGWRRRKPCIVSKGAGISELVQDGVNGFTFSPGNVDELVEKLRTVLSSPESASKMGENGLMTAELCSIDSAVKSQKAAFEKVIKLY